MSIRRRTIKARVETRERLDRGVADSEALLAEVQEVIDSFKAEGRVKVTQEEFAVRLHALRTTVSEEAKHG